MTREQLLELENAALRKQAMRLSTMLDIALSQLRDANDKVEDEYMRRRKAESTLAGLRHANFQCAVLGIQPMYTEN